MSPTVRLFTAVLPPQTALQTLLARYQELIAIDPGLRWARPGDWHLTCSFMPKAEESLLADLGAALDQLTSTLSPFPMRLAGAGIFGPVQAARHLWVGVDKGEAELRDLALSARRAALSLQIEADPGSFRPHLTLGRWRVPGQAKELLAALQDYQGPDFEVDQLCLLRSRPMPGRTQYEVVSTHQLVG